MQTPYMIDNALFQVYRRPFRPLAPSRTAPRPREPSMCQALCRCSHADLAPHLRNHGHVTHGFACHGMSDTCPMHGMLCFHGATALDSCKIPICGTNFMHSHTQVYACECMKYACEGTSHKSQCMPERFRSILSYMARHGGIARRDESKLAVEVGARPKPAHGT